MTLKCEFIFSISGWMIEKKKVMLCSVSMHINMSYSVKNYFFAFVLLTGAKVRNGGFTVTSSIMTTKVVFLVI